MKKIRITLEAARVNAKMTQEEVSKHLNVSRRSIINWENGKSYPTFQTVSELADLYKIPIDNIFLPKKST